MNWKINISRMHHVYIIFTRNICLIFVNTYLYSLSRIFMHKSVYNCINNMIHIIVIYTCTSYNIIYNRYKLITNIIGNIA